MDILFMVFYFGGTMFFGLIGMFIMEYIDKRNLKYKEV